MSSSSWDNGKITLTIMIFRLNDSLLKLFTLIFKLFYKKGFQIYDSKEVKDKKYNFNIPHIFRKLNMISWSMDYILFYILQNASKVSSLLYNNNDADSQNNYRIQSNLEKRISLILSGFNIKSRNSSIKLHFISFQECSDIYIFFLRVTNP